jgi:hypothetical protein
MHVSFTKDCMKPMGRKLSYCIMARWVHSFQSGECMPGAGQAVTAMDETHVMAVEDFVGYGLLMDM